MADIVKNAGDTSSITVPEGVHTFNGNFIGGGGGGGAGYNSMGDINGGGGGGAGSIAITSAACTPGTVWTSSDYSVGAGGAGGTTGAPGSAGSTGGDTFFLGATNTGYGGSGGATGMGGGAGGSFGGYAAATTGFAGSNGYNGTTNGAGGNTTSAIGGTGGAAATNSTTASVGGNYGAGGGSGYGEGTYQVGGDGAPGRLELTWATRTDLYAPSSINHNTVTEDGATVTWTDNSSYESGYEIEAYTGSPTGIATHTSAANTGSKVITGLDPDQLYYFKVRAVDSVLSIASTWEGSDSFTTDPLAFPDTLSASSITSTGADLSWSNNSTSNDDYDLDIVPYGDSFNTEGAETNISCGASPLTVTGLTPNTHYKFRVRATKDATFVSGWYYEYDFTTDNGLITGNYFGLCG